MSAPEFDLEDFEGRRWRLGDLEGKKVILYFYPADDTPGCTAEACDFRDSKPTLDGAGYVVLGVSPQGAASHRAFAAKYGLNFPLLIDDGLEVAARYGADDDGRARRRVTRSTFVIDERGRIVEALYGVKAPGHVRDLSSKLGLETASPASS